MKLRDCFDRVRKSSDKWSGYFEIYDRHLPSWHGTSDTVLVEVGVQKGGSLDMWSSYLDNYQQIIGIDIDPECLKLGYTRKTKVVIGDQGDPNFWDTFLTEHPKIDIFIDDGGHHVDQQITTFEKVFPRLSLGGVYFCEDTHTSYMKHNGGGLGVRNTFVEYAKSYADVLHQDWWESMTTDLDHKKKIVKGLSSLHIYDSMVVFEKYGKVEMNRVFPERFEQT